MQVVIDIDDGYYKYIKNHHNFRNAVDYNVVITAICNGVILPKGHGNLIDAKDLIPDADYEDGIFGAVSCQQIVEAEAIIEADSEPCDDYNASYCEQRDCAECEYNSGNN